MSMSLQLDELEDDLEAEKKRKGEGDTSGESISTLQYVPSREVSGISDCIIYKQ